MNTINTTKDGFANVATHNGIFHCDDVTAVAILSIINPDLRVMRSRNPEVLAGADIRVDVGGVNDTAAGTYDHHFKGSEARDNGVIYAASGLVWRRYGKEAIRTVLSHSDVQSRTVVRLLADIDRGFIQPIDKADTAPTPTQGLSLSQVIAQMNPTHVSPESENPDAKFTAAVAVVSTLLRDAIVSAYAEIDAEAAVKAAFRASTDGVAVLESFVPWHAYAGLPEAQCANYIVFPSAGSADWMCQCIPTKVGSFDQKRPLPQAWFGLRGDDLVSASGVVDAVFCHPGGFICGAKTKHGALALAREASE